MWRAQTSRKGHHILNALRQLATESNPLPLPRTPSKLSYLRYVKFLGFSFPVATGSVVGYAWYDPDFRLLLEDNIPYARELLKNILPENKIDPEIRTSQGPEIQITAGKNIGQDSVVQSRVSKIDDFAPTGRKLASAEAVQEGDRIGPFAVDVQPKRKEEDEKADNAALEAMITKLLANSQSLVAETVKAQSEAASSIRNHARLLKQGLDMEDDTEKDAYWQNVALVLKEKEQAMLRASERVSESKKCVEKLQDVIQEGKANPVTQNNPAITTASLQLTDLMKDLGNANSQVRQAESEANMVQRYKELIEKERKQFQKEIESLVPASKSGSDGEKNFTEDDLNALIAHAYRRIEQLQNQIAVLQDVEKQKVASALKSQRQEDRKITDAIVAEERQHLHDEFASERSKLEMEHLIGLENEVRKQLARQAAAHADHVKDVLAVQQKELEEEYNRTLQMKLLEEREKFQTEVASWIARLNGIDAAIQARAASEKITQHAQNLWLACIALNSVVQFGDDQGGSAQLKPLRNNVAAILRAGGEHPFVQTVANTFPSAVLDRGVSTEDELRHRFYRVFRICHRLGLVDSTNTSIYRYILSYLHSLVVFDNVATSSELEEVDINTLDTFGLLAYARYWMDKGNLDLALRFMIQLTGESRWAASDWINEARLLLETKQIALTLTAYAAASGLAKTF